MRVVFSIGYEKTHPRELPGSLEGQRSEAADRRPCRPPVAKERLFEGQSRRSVELRGNQIRPLTWTETPAS